MNDERFAFGKNWQRYISKSYSPERLDIAKRHLLEFLDREDLVGLNMVDIGCGSGLHSLAAFQAGAQSIRSFDYDPDSVRTAQYLHSEMADSPPNWSIEQGSVLDREYMDSLGKFDLVYSWGVLHHTGDQWTAIRNAASLVADGGLFYIALYSADPHVDPTPEFWLEVKKKYISSTPFQQNLMVLWYMWRFDMGRNPFRIPWVVHKILTYKFSRGMNYITDVRDWIGGWPMEFSWDQEVLDMADKELNFDLVRIRQGEANTEYVFKKRT